MSEWIDATIALEHGMAHWPGDPDVLVERISDMEMGAACNVSRLVLSSHTGTHMDAPLHFLKDGASIDTFPFSLMQTKATVIQIDDKECVKAEELTKHTLTEGQVILFRTDNSEVGWTRDFRKNFVYIAPDAAEFCAEKKVAMVGIDYMSVGGFFKHSEETHHAFLKAGIWLVENVNLKNVHPGVYDMLCVPLLIANGDGAPTRVLLRLCQDDDK